MRFMPRLVIALLLALAPTGPAGAVERILRFVSDVEVERNGDLLVTETIRVQVEQNRINHGIFRDFPTTDTRPDGSRAVVGFRVQSVMRDGLDERWTSESVANGVRVTIGRPEILLWTGQHEFVIRYRTTRQVGFFASYDELYWNATGNGWAFPIDSAEARITLPQAVPFGQTALYTGPQGARGQDGAIVERRDGHILFRTTKPLAPNNGLTVAVAWPKGIVIPPTASELWLADNLPGVISGVGLAAALAFYAFAWLKVGRDPPRGTIIPLFGPPAGMSAAAVRYVERMGFDPKCFSAAIVDLGVNGHIKLTGEGKKTVIERRDGGKPVGAPERALETKLFASRPSLLLDQANYEPLGKAKNALKDGLVEAYDGTLFTDNYLWSGLGLVLSVILLGATLAVMINTYDSDRAGLLLTGMLVPVVPIVVGAFLIREGRQRDSYGWLFIGAGVVLVAGAALLGLAKMVGSEGGPLGWCRALPPTSWRRWGCSASAGCRPRPSRGAASWIRSRASANISASPRKTGSTRSIRRTRHRNCSSAFCPTRSRWLSRTAGPRALPRCWRPPASALRSAPGIPAARAGATIRSASPISWAAPSRTRSRPPRARPDRAVGARAAAATRAAAGAAAAAAGGERRPCRMG